MTETRLVELSDPLQELFHGFAYQMGVENVFFALLLLQITLFGAEILRRNLEKWFRPAPPSERTCSPQTAL